MDPGGTEDDREDARVIARLALEHAAAAPAPAELATLAERAATVGPERREALRELMSTALSRAQEVSYLMGELAGLQASEGWSAGGQ